MNPVYTILLIMFCVVVFISLLLYSSFYLERKRKEERERSGQPEEDVLDRLLNTAERGLDHLEATAHSRTPEENARINDMLGRTFEKVSPELFYIATGKKTYDELQPKSPPQLPQPPPRKRRGLYVGDEDEP